MKKIHMAYLCGIMILLSGCSKNNESSNPKNDMYVVDCEMDIEFNFGNRNGIYTGCINKNGVPDGYGSFKSANASGSNWIYYGEWNNGHMDGNGITEWDDYSHYGLYKSDYMEGVGMYNMNSGSVYCGEFSESELISSYIPESFYGEEDGNAQNDVQSSEIPFAGIFSDDYIHMAIWASTAFGDSASYSEIGNMDSASGRYVQVIVPSSYTANDTKTIITEIGQSFALLKALDVDYDTISVKYLNADNNEILDCEFVGNGDGSYSLSTINGNVEEIETIINGINQYSQQK